MRYGIKHTYHDSGKVFYLVKGGYVKKVGDTIIDNETYTTLQTAKMVATKYNKENEYYKRVGSICASNSTYEAVAID